MNNQIPTAAEEQEILIGILDVLEDAVIVIDRATHVEFVNRRARQMFPSLSKPVGRLLIEVVQQESISSLAAEGIRLVTPIRRELVLPGPRRIVLVTSVAPVSESGERFGVILRDETRRYETEQVRKDFVANASHELRTPLTIINGYLENLLDEAGLEDSAMARQMLQTMKKHGDRIASIVEDMLTISKLESSASSLLAKSFSLASCVGDVVDRLAPKLDRSRVTITRDIPGDVVLWGDRYYWDQVFFNLLDNALKYNPTGPLEIAIRYRRTAEGDHEIRVSDNGIGISRKDLPYVFNRFYRSEYQPHQSVKGTGLGLSIVKRSVEAHHGEVWLTSTPGVETEFTIRVPDLDPERGKTSVE